MAYNSLQIFIIGGVNVGYKWFNGVFVPSLFERAGVNHLMWLSAKQTQICVENFDSIDKKKITEIKEDLAILLN